MLPQVHESINFRDASDVTELFEAAAQAMQSSPLRQGSAVRVPARGRLIATGDLHDNPAHLQKIIRITQLEKSADHHVVLHEIIHSERLINSMDFSHRMLARVAELTLQYPQQVHPLLANHELAQLTGKGISKGAGNSVELFNDGLEFAFGDDWEMVSAAIKTFIAAMALALISDSSVLCAHSLPASHMMHRFDFDVLQRALEPKDYESPFGSAHLMVWGRGHGAAHLEEIARQWNVRLFCLGHEHAETGIEMITPKCVVLNSDHERGVALPIDLATPFTAEDAMMHAVPLSAINS